MKKLKIWALSIIMIFSFSGLLLLQVSYIEKMVKMRNEQFDESVKRSLNQVSHNLEYDETLKYLENELYKSIDDDKMPHSGSLLQHRYKSYAKGNDIYSSFELRTITMQPAQTPKIIITRDNFNKNKTIKQTTETLQETLKNKFVFQRSLLDEVALNILYQASEVPITKRINIKQLDYYIKKELNNNGINLNYHYTIHDNSGHEIYRCSDFDAKGIDKAYQQTLYQNDIQNNSGTIVLHFPDRGAYMYNSIKFMIPSIIFIVILLITFIVTIYSITMQKKLKN